MYEYLSKEGVKTLLNNITAKWLRYDNSESGLDATTVQEALDELKSLIQSGGGSIDPETPSEPGATETPTGGLLGELGITESALVSMIETTQTVKIGGVDFYVLAVSDKDTYETNAGGTAISKRCACLFAKDPWKSTQYAFNGSSGRWYLSELRTTLETELATNDTLLKLAEYVDSSVVNAGGNMLESYDRFFPLSVAEFNEHGLSGSDIAKDNIKLGSAPNYYYRWTRTPDTTSYVHIVTGSSGVITSNFLANYSVNPPGVRPIMWVSLEGGTTATTGAITYASLLEGMGIESTGDNATDAEAVIELGLGV